MFSLIPRLTVATIAASVAAVLALPLPAAAQPQPPKTDTSRGLSIRYADGRVSTGPLRRTGGMWTAEFPTIAGADTSREGVRLTTLDIKHVIDGADVVVTVSLFYGGPGQRGVKVATVRLSGTEPVHVNELRAYGVEPIVLSLVPIAATVAYAPTSQRIGTVDRPRRGRRPQCVGLSDRGHEPIRSAPDVASYKAYRGDRLAILGRPRGKRNQPLVLPNAEYRSR